MKKSLIVIVMIMSLFVVTGCSKKKSAVSIDEFNKVASDNGISLKDYTAYYGNTNKALQYSNEDLVVIFQEGKTEVDMYNKLLDEARNVYDRAGIQDEYPTAVAGETTTKPPRNYVSNGNGWETVEVITNDRYYYLAYVGKTFLYLEGNLDNKDKLVKIKDTIKY